MKPGKLCVKALLCHYTTSIPHFTPHSGGVVCSVTEVTEHTALRFATLPERGNENIKYFISSSGNRNQNLSPKQPTTTDFTFCSFLYTHIVNQTCKK